jgi:hypothetical protein
MRDDVLRRRRVRFALEAEGVCADIAGAADSLAPDAAWRSKLDELVCGHRDRVEKLTMIRQEVNEMILESIHSLDGAQYLDALDAEPAGQWPAVVDQLFAAEGDAARYHEDFVTTADDVVAASARAFKRAAKQDRAAADEVKEMLA